jgi:transcriptional regulator of acetoin/glycerol metabolism
VFDLPVEIRQPQTYPVSDKDLSVPIKARVRGKNLSKEILLELLDACDWNKAEVARRIGLSRTAVWKYMKKWGIPLKNPA